MNNNTYKITYIQNQNDFKEHTFNLKHKAIYFYLQILTSKLDIASLKIFKNDKDYTLSLNKFLYK